MFGNPQIFGTDVYFLQRFSQHQITNHTITTAFENLTFYNEPLLLLFGFLLATHLIGGLVYKFTSKDASTIDLGSEKNEDVKFIKVLGTLQRQMLKNAEKRNREVFGFKKLQDEFFKELQEIKVCHANCKTSLLGIHTY